MDPITVLKQVRSELKALFVERDELVDGVLVALLARQHLLVIGPPGTAKSMLARELCRRIGGRYFEWLLTKFTTPEEIFGPVSLPELEAGRYERVTSGKLPEADVAFLDEVFKANSAILNSLLTILNERRFYQGTRVTDVPLCTLVAASNELPEEEELEALYDRFLLRFTVGYVERDESFKKLLSLEEPAPGSGTVVDGEALAELWSRTDAVKLGRGLVAELAEVRRRLGREGVLASDRRYRQSLTVLRAAALLDGRKRADHRDLVWLEHVLWSDPEERSKVLEVVSSLEAGVLEDVRKLRRQVDEIESYARRSWPTETDRERALVEAHTKLEEIRRRFQAMCDQLRERGRDPREVEEEERRVVDVQRALLASEGSWQS